MSTVERNDKTDRERKTKPPKLWVTRGLKKKVLMKKGVKPTSQSDFQPTESSVTWVLGESLLL
jgi:hypothetical protein